MRRRGFPTEPIRSDRRSVTSVISIVLLVAIAVVLTAVIGTVALGMAEDVSTAAPQASFGVEQHEVSFGSTDYNVVFITHKFGDSVEAENVRVTVNGQPAWDVAGMEDGPPGRTVRPTTRVEKLQSGTMLRLVYWENQYEDYPIGAGELVQTHSGGCGHVLTTDGVSDCALNSDLVGEGDHIRIVYEFPDSGGTVTLDELTV